MKSHEAEHAGAKISSAQSRPQWVWMAFNDWGGVWRFQPWVVRSPILSQNKRGIGASRRCEFVDNTSIVETITHITEGRRIEMRLTETPKPMLGGTAVISLEPQGTETDVMVTMNVELGMGLLNPLMGNLMMKPMMKSRIGRMLQSLEFHLRTGGKINHKGKKIRKADQIPSAA